MHFQCKALASTKVLEWWDEEKWSYRQFDAGTHSVGNKVPIPCSEGGDSETMPGLDHPDM